MKVTIEDPNKMPPIIRKFLNADGGDISIKDLEERKKKLFLCLLLPACGAFILALVVSVALHLNFLGVIFGFAGVGALAIFFFLLSSMKKLKAKLILLDCPKCHHRISYDDHTKFEILSKKFSVYSHSNDRKDKNGVPTTSQITAEGTETVMLKVFCKCQNCGAEKQFNLTLDTLSITRRSTDDYTMSGARRIQFEKEIKEEYAAKEDGTASRVPAHLRSYFNNTTLVQ